MNDTNETKDAGEPDVPGGSLADAIAAHLELKKEHGADPVEVERELESALSPTRRDADESVDLHPADEVPAAESEAVEAAEPVETSVPEPASEPAPEPEPPHHTELVSEPLSADPANAALDAVAVPFEIEVNDEPAPRAEPQPEPAAEQPSPGQVTGTFEFEFGEGDKPAEPQDKDERTSEQIEHDLLEDTPDFFEETPEHDKLWFDEAPPKKFDF